MPMIEKNVPANDQTRVLGYLRTDPQDACFKTVMFRKNDCLLGLSL
jgi:hypothetical protein